MNTELLNDLRRFFDQHRTYQAQVGNTNRAACNQTFVDACPDEVVFQSNKLISVFPWGSSMDDTAPTHNYVRMVYTCAGETTHIINGKTVVLRAGELLLLNNSVTHRVIKSESDDLLVSVHILPAFFSKSVVFSDCEETPLYRFFVGCLCDRNSTFSYLHFLCGQSQVIQNLMENFVWAVVHCAPNYHTECQTIIAIVFLQLLGQTEKLSLYCDKELLIWQVLHYIECNYANGSFDELTQKFRCDAGALSRCIKLNTGKTFTQLLKEKRLAQSAFLLSNTNMNVEDIAIEVGYASGNYLKRLFVSTFGKTPKEYRNIKGKTYFLR